MNKYALTAKEREWLFNRAKNLHCFGLNTACTPGVSLALIDYKDALEFEARAKVTALRTDISELPCVRGDKKSCPLKKPGVGCGDWCRLRLAHIKTEEEMGHAND